ncbi:capsule biosynthesis protein [Formicincola oecophyllae]|uniref:Capsule biosynthesis protein n=1 Tax=Formicincola oecophyllae TaxID=2558361 RepID=A0A4Y6UAF4_9PROT|nr:capsule biosynthesis protein [Formicincola oecophyllae]QDH13417.2 capsule biosynthesis protein [Formicincola oecophyllae]
MNQVAYGEANKGFFSRLMEKIWKYIENMTVKQWMFFLIVIFPTTVVAIYLWCFASPQYISETHFLVRGKSTSSMPAGLGSLIEGSSGASEDTYAVEDFMMSRDAAQMLLKTPELHNMFSHSYIDEFARFPSIFTRKDFESFYKYYKRHVKAEIDEEDSISHLTVRAFSPHDAQEISKWLVKGAEKLVNDMNERQRQNLIAASQREINETRKELHDVELNLARYRHSNEIIDPLKQSTPMVSTAYSFEVTLSMLRADLVQLMRTSPHSPLIQVYKQRIASLQAQVNQAEAHVVGRDPKSMIPKITAYDELLVDQKIVQKKLSTETAALEMAKQQADKERLYITIITQPSLPDYPVYPKDTIILIITLVTTLGVYVTGSLLVAGAREHALQ